MNLRENQFYMLKDIHVLSKAGLSGGCLPMKDALIYNQDDLEDLQEREYVKPVTLMMPCGGQIRGFKLTHRGEWTLRKMEAKAFWDAHENLPQAAVLGECLTPDQVDILLDIYHFCRLTRSGGLLPRREAENFQHDDLEYLYLNGYIMKIQTGQGSGKKEKGFVLSNKGEQVVKLMEEPLEMCH
jgi:hypothetical protein